MNFRFILLLAICFSPILFSAFAEGDQYDPEEAKERVRLSEKKQAENEAFYKENYTGDFFGINCNSTVPLKIDIQSPDGEVAKFQSGITPPLHKSIKFCSGACREVGESDPGDFDIDIYKVQDGDYKFTIQPVKEISLKARNQCQFDRLNGESAPEFSKTLTLNLGGLAPDKASAEISLPLKGTYKKEQLNFKSQDAKIGTEFIDFDVTGDLPGPVQTALQNGKSLAFSFVPVAPMEKYRRNNKNTFILSKRNFRPNGDILEFEYTDPWISRTTEWNLSFDFKLKKFKIHERTNDFLSRSISAKAAPIANFIVGKMEYFFQGKAYEKSSVMVGGILKHSLNMKDFNSEIWQKRISKNSAELLLAWNAISDEPLHVEWKVKDAPNGAVGTFSKSTWGKEVTTFKTNQNGAYTVQASLLSGEKLIDVREKMFTSNRAPILNGIKCRSESGDLVCESKGMSDPDGDALRLECFQPLGPDDQDDGTVASDGKKCTIKKAGRVGVFVTDGMDGSQIFFVNSNRGGTFDPPRPATQYDLMP
jgi:hypothetical protein